MSDERPRLAQIREESEPSGPVYKDLATQLREMAQPILVLDRAEGFIDGAGI